MPAPSSPGPDDIARYALHNVVERMGRIEEEVNGLRDAHKATVAAMESNTLAMTGLNATIQRIDSTIERRLNDLAVSYSDHLVAEEKDKNSMKYLAIKLWASWFSAMGLGLVTLWAYRREISEFLGQVKW